MHGQNQTFLRYFQELRFELADINDGPFHQRSDFIQQTIGLIDLGAQRLCLGCQLAADGAAALSVVSHDLAFGTQSLCIGRCIRNGDQPLRQEAMSQCLLTRLQAQHFTWH